MGADAPRQDGDEGAGLEAPEVLLERVRSALEAVVQLLPGSPSDGPAPSARDLASGQAAIIAEAHHEAAEVVAAAHAEAARILERATAAASATAGPNPEVIDLRDGLDAPRSPASPAGEGSVPGPAELTGAMRERLAAVDADLRAAISATGDIAQEVSSQIARVAGHAAQPGLQ